MTASAIDIERIVREVLAQLAAAPQACAAKPQAVEAKPQTPDAKPQVAEVKAAEQPFTLNISTRVVTMNDVAGQLDSIRRVVVSREAIVTPAVRDELLRRGITLESGKSAETAPATLRLSLMTSGIDFDPAALLAALTREGFQATPSTSDCLIAASEQLAGEIRQGDTLGVLITRHAAAAICLANRLSGVRAICGIEAPAVAAASVAIGANLLVADPRAGTFFQLKQAITEFARGGIRPCPAALRERLG